jgi:type VI secretion system secreted protein Hcp
MAFDAFLKIDGIPGESTDDKHRDWIEILSFSHNLDQSASATASSAGGATAERVNHGAFNIVHLLDLASPKLHEACCTGKHIKEIVIELCRAGSDKVKYAEIWLEQAIISAISLCSEEDADFPKEFVSFSYGKIRWLYIQQKRSNGAGGGSVLAGWDLTRNSTYA